MSARSRSGKHREGTRCCSWKRWLEMLVNHVMVFQFCRPIWDMWVRYALMTGELSGSVEDYRQVRWVAPPLEMLDARAEVLGLQARVRCGFMSRTEVVNANGLDAEQLEAEIAAENRRADALGLVFDSDPRRTTAQGQEQPTAVDDAPPPAVTEGGNDAVDDQLKFRNSRVFPLLGTTPALKNRRFRDVQILNICSPAMPFST